MLFKSLPILLTLVLSVASSYVPGYARSPRATDDTKGTILVPTSGTAIEPAGNFTFTYSPRADYGVSTFAYHVFLLDAAATTTTLSAVDVFSTGYYFGRFDYPNYPAVPYALNPCPAELTMPDFSKSPGGFAAGESASNIAMQLAVVEEWGNGDPSVGRKFGLALTAIVYNATTTT